MQLPYYQTMIKELSLLQTKWKSILDPVLANPITQGGILMSVPLASGVNTINHLLGRKLVGWTIIGINGAAVIYDIQASNQKPELTLVLQSNASVLVNLEVF